MSRRGVIAPPRFVVLDKSVGVTSFDCVRRLRSILGERKVGHGGTLDPFATGVLVCATGPATRLLSILSEGDKEYVAELRFGVATDSLDSTGEIVEERPVAFSAAQLEQACGRFLGDQMQVPPRLSAIKVDGRRSYRRYRDGDKDFELQPRPVRIDSIEVEAFQDSSARLRVVCGGGTYIRSLARDIGRDLDTVAHLSGLRRTRVGAFSLAEAITLEELEAEGPAVARAILPAARLVRHWARIEVSFEQAQRLRQGQQPSADWLDLPAALPKQVAFLDPADGLVAVAELREPEELRLRTVLPATPSARP